jgi:hypothetical protein
MKHIQLFEEFTNENVNLEKEKERLKKLVKSKNFDKLMDKKMAKKTEDSFFARIDRLGTTGYPSPSGWVRGGERDSVQQIEQDIEAVERIWSK